MSQAHWYCRICGTFDGPMSDDLCDVCGERGARVVWLVPAEKANRLALDVNRYRQALEVAEKGLGSLLWVLNNRHNWADPRYDDLAESAEEDARAGMAAIKEARGA